MQVYILLAPLKTINFDHFQEQILFIISTVQNKVSQIYCNKFHQLFYFNNFIMFIGPYTYSESATDKMCI